MKKSLWLLLSLTSLWAVSPDQALQMLKEGNLRFATDHSLYPDRTSERRQETTAKQEPFAVIVGCSDSRVAPEILFDQGIGDLFIVRVAGNVVGSLELESIEYSTFALHSALIVVLGHEDCDAVNAVMQGATNDIASIAMLVAPAIEGAKNSLESAVKANVASVVKQLSSCPRLKKRIASKELSIVGGYYNFHTGKVEFLK